METIDGMDVLTFEDPAALDTWLAAHHERPGVWLKLAKKASGVPSVTAKEALDVALCYGWIDGRRQGLDDVWYLQKITPRRARSTWSKVNIRKVEDLMAAGRMREPGLAAIRAAQADGRWDAAYESQKNATVPPDLAAALEQDAAAKAAFEALGKTDKYLAILPLLKARTTETRTARLNRTLAQLNGSAPSRSGA